MWAVCGTGPPAAEGTNECSEKGRKEGRKEGRVVELTDACIHFSFDDCTEL